MGSCEFWWVLVGSGGEGGEALKKKSPPEPIRTYQNLSEPILIRERVSKRVLLLLWVLMSSCGFL